MPSSHCIELKLVLDNSDGWRAPHHDHRFEPEPSDVGQHLLDDWLESICASGANSSQGQPIHLVTTPARFRCQSVLKSSWNIFVSLKSFLRPSMPPNNASKKASVSRRQADGVPLIRHSDCDSTLLHVLRSAKTAWCAPRQIKSRSKNS